DGLPGLAVAGGSERTAAEAEVHRRDIARPVHGIHTLETRDEVGRVRADTWRVEQPAIGDGREFREHLHRHDLRAGRDTRKRDARGRSVTRRDAGDVSTMEAALSIQRARHRRPGPQLLFSAVRAESSAVSCDRTGVAGLFNDLAAAEGARRI